MLKFSDLINRLRHNRGFGVQSPSAFFFVTQVLKEHHPYYAYADIDKKSKKRGKYFRRLFRIANYLQPGAIIVIDKERETAVHTLKAARQNATLHSAQEATAEVLQKIADTPAGTLLLYIGECNNYAQACATAINCAQKGTAIIIEGIHNTPEKLQWWETIIKSPRTIVTYDLYSAGIILFDTEKPKQHYTLKM